MTCYFVLRVLLVFTSIMCQTFSSISPDLILDFEGSGQLPDSDETYSASEETASEENAVLSCRHKELIKCIENMHHGNASYKDCKDAMEVKCDQELNWKNYTHTHEVFLEEKEDDMTALNIQNGSHPLKEDGIQDVSSKASMNTNMLSWVLIILQIVVCVSKLNTEL